MSCIIKSVTLQANESFVLPPGATLIAATDPKLITVSPDGCTPIDNLETLKCYAYRFSGQLGRDSNRTQNWELQEDNFFVEGIVINDVYYPFASSIQGWQNYTSFQSVIDTVTQFSGIITAFSNGMEADSYVNLGGNSGWTNVVYIKTVPSIANTLLFKISTVVQNQASVPGGSSTVAYVKGDITACPSIP